MKNIELWYIIRNLALLQKKNFCINMLLRHIKQILYFMYSIKNNNAITKKNNIHSLLTYLDVIDDLILFEFLCLILNASIFMKY